MTPGRRRGATDQRVRDALRPLVRSGRAVCRRCGKPIPADVPEDEWDAGHLDDLGTGGHPDGARLPEHAHCNRSAGAILGNQLRRPTPAHRRPRLDRWLE